MLLGLDLPTLAVLAWLGVLLDWCVGEVRRWHPLVGFGNVANALERRLNRGRGLIWRGTIGWILAVIPLTLLALLLCSLDYAGLALHGVLLYFCIGLRSLRDHTQPIAHALQQGDLPLARALTARIVSRDTAHSDTVALSKAATESLLENGNDAVFGTLFWFVLTGGPGALLFRLANTLDAMWGYRTPRFNQFGRGAARIDDGLNWLPARLTALSYCALAATTAGRRRAWHCWRTQAPAWSSPNAGPVMASGAGALGLALGGIAVYGGVSEQRPPLGLGSAPGADDIARAGRLVTLTALLWLGLLSLAAVGGHFWM
ncbi:MAG: adenosylcobinamide-phosphate synthase CbiB [Pseudomonadota bacterium]